MPATIDSNNSNHKLTSSVENKMISKNKILLIVKITFIIFICTLLYRIFDWKQVGQAFQNVSIGYFLIVMIVIMGDKIIMGMKWNILLNLYNVSVPYYVPIIAYLKGMVFPLFIPSNVGIDIYKAYHLKKYDNSLSKIISSIVVERIIGILSSIAMISLMLPFSVRFFPTSHKNFLIISGYLLFLVITSFVVFIIPRGTSIRFPRKIKFLPAAFYNKIDKFLLSLSLIKDKKSHIIIYYFSSIIEKAFYGLAIFFSTRAIGFLEIDFFFIIAATPFLALLERIPISFCALGLREGLIVFLLKPYIESPELSFSVAIVLRSAEILAIFLSLFLWIKSDRSGKFQTEIHSVSEKALSITKRT